MSQSIEILVFGDQASISRADLTSLIDTPKYGNVSKFMHDCVSVLQLEIFAQPREKRRLFPAFSSLDDLIPQYGERKTLHPAIDSALAVLCQLVTFYDSQNSTSTSLIDRRGSLLVGSCTGLLSAAAVRLSDDVEAFLDIAKVILRLAFRTGLLVNDHKQKLDSDVTDPGSWSIALSGLDAVDAESAIESFCDSLSLSSVKRPYVSAILTDSITISGPPSILSELLQVTPFKDLRSARLPIFGPYHASHLYVEDEIDALLEDVSDSTIPQKKQSRLFSTSRLDSQEGSTLKSVLQSVLRDILLFPIRWDLVVDQISNMVDCKGATMCVVAQPFVSTAGRTVTASLQNLGKKVEVQNLSQLSQQKKDWFPKEEHDDKHEKIAICGLSGRFPDSADHEQFWTLLEKGMDLHRAIPKDRFNVDTHVDTSGKKLNTSHTPFGCFIDEPGLFDPKFFNISPREAAQTDPMQRLALVTSYEALEMAGFVSDRTASSRRDRVGTFFGQTSDDWREINAAQKIDTYFIPGGVRPFGPGRINYYFKFSGPSYSIDTACSSSLAAIQIACTSLKAGECDTALAGGMNVLTNPDIFSGLSRGQFLSKTGSCQTFDDAADGYCRGDAVGTVVLKRLADAEKDNDPILGVILSSATNHSANAVSITHPHAATQEILTRKALASARVDPHDISYVEMHGTGTQAGDAIEMESVMNAFAPSHRQRKTSETLYLGAVKANAGHGEAASGVTSLVKILLMLQKNVIPPHCGIKGTINHTFPKDFDKRNVVIPNRAYEWPRPEHGKRHVFLNNFSAAGGNTALVLEDSPSSDHTSSEDPRSKHVVTTSAKAEVSLIGNIQRLIGFLESNPDADIRDVAYSTSRRTHHRFRLAASVSNVQDLKAQLDFALTKEVRQPTTKSPRRIFVFTGQGSQYEEMGRALFEKCSSFRRELVEMDQMSVSLGFPSFLAFITGSKDTEPVTPGPVALQIGMACLEIALASLWQAWGIIPSVVLGHSLGEYAALCCSGVLSVLDTIFLVGKRATLLQEHCTEGTHTMLALKSSLANISSLLESSSCEVACVNGPEEVVVSGTLSDIENFRRKMEENSLKSKQLEVPFAFHSSQVEPILDAYQLSAASVKFGKPSVPVISPLLGEVVTKEGQFNHEYIRRHCRKPVNFLGSIEAAKHANLVSNDDIWIEVGPQPICTGMVQAILGPKVQCMSSLRRNEDPWNTITSSLGSLYNAGFDIDWSEYYRDYGNTCRVLSLPAYAWNNKNYWIDYVNDWCLHKIDGPSPVQTKAPESVINSTTVQCIIEDKCQGSLVDLTVQSDLSEPKMKAAILGHSVNGHGLVPPSLYADIALTSANYILKKHFPRESQVDLNACDMRVDKPLIVHVEGEHLIQVSLKGDFTRRKVDVGVFSIDSGGKQTVQHAGCGVKFEDRKSWRREWNRATYLVQSRIKALRNEAKQGLHDTIRRGMVYKLFSSLITYSDKYRGIEELVLDSVGLEATSSVKFQADEKDGDFYMNPYWFDCLAHLSGFTVIGNESAENSKEVYVSHGFEDCRIAEPLSASKNYKAYVKMEYIAQKSVMGDVYVFESDKIVAVVSGLQFNCLPRKLLDSILASAAGPSKRVPMANVNRPAASKPTPAAEPKPQKMRLESKNSAVAAPPSGVVVQAMKVISEETGVLENEMLDANSLSDLGIDSLLSLSVTGRLKEELNIDIESSVFMDCSTIKDVKALFGQQDTSSASDLLDSSSGSPGEDEPSEAADESSQTSVSADGKEKIGEGKDNGLLASIRQTILAELGVEDSELDAKTDLTQLGLDSLMSLTIQGQVKEDTGVDVPGEFFAEHNTLGAMEKTLGMHQHKSGGESEPQSGFHKDVRIKIAQDSTDFVQDVPSSSTSPYPSASTSASSTQPVPAATSVLLCGNAQTATHIIFLFPDGSGSATSYSRIRNAASNIAIFGLNCPFLKTPESLQAGLSHTTPGYIEEIRRRQAHGPYHLGGWSAGGIFAYDAALALQAAGETVSSLILIDSPCPWDIREPLPFEVIEHFLETDLLGPNSGLEKKKPEWLMRHFRSVIANVASYNPSKPRASFKTYVLWAERGTEKNGRKATGLEEDVYDVPHARWLLDDRPPSELSSSGGWERLVGPENIARVQSLPDVNHFTMMRAPKVDEVGSFIGSVVA